MGAEAPSDTRAASSARVVATHEQRRELRRQDDRDDVADPESGQLAQGGLIDGSEKRIAARTGQRRAEPRSRAGPGRRPRDERRTADDLVAAAELDQELVVRRPPAADRGQVPLDIVEDEGDP